MSLLTFNTNASGSGIFAHISAFVAREIEIVRVGRARQKLYRKTICELSNLTDRELADIGLTRSDIPATALDAANRV